VCNILAKGRLNVDLRQQLQHQQQASTRRRSTAGLAGQFPISLF